MYTPTLLEAIVAATTLVSSAAAWQPPNYDGFTRQWQATFIGGANGQPSSTNWNIIESTNPFNNELQSYTSSTRNVRYSGDGTLQLIPLHDGTGPHGWSSGRIESKYTFTPTARKITRVEASLRLAGNPASHKQGLWPAFWMLGDSYRHGVLWPACGEIDVMENINGQSYAQGAAHCDVAPGGRCNEPSGLVNGLPLNDNKYHVWRVEFDRIAVPAAEQVITWYMDGQVYNRITGAQIGDSKVFKTLAQAPLYFILNVAMGGDWPGPPNSDTWDGTGNMMEIGYVAHYVSN